MNPTFQSIYEELWAGPEKPETADLQEELQNLSGQLVELAFAGKRGEAQMLNARIEEICQEAIQRKEQAKDEEPRFRPNMTENELFEWVRWSLDRPPTILEETKAELGKLWEEFHTVKASNNQEKLSQIIDTLKEIYQDLPRERKMLKEVLGVRSHNYMRVLTKTHDSGWLNTGLYPEESTKRYARKHCPKEAVWYLIKRDNARDEHLTRNSGKIENDGIPQNLWATDVKWNNQFTLPNLENPPPKKTESQESEMNM